MGCKYAADELIAAELSIAKRKVRQRKDRIEIAVTLDESRPGELKICFGELRFDEKIPEPQIDFGVIGPAALEGYAGFESKLHLRITLDAEDVLHIDTRQHLRMAEDIHQQRIGAVGTVKLSPSPIGTQTKSPRRSMDFFEAAGPGRVGAYGLKGSGMKVAVAPMLIAPENDAGSSTVGVFGQITVRFGELMAAKRQLRAERKRIHIFVAEFLIHRNL